MDAGIVNFVEHMTQLGASSENAESLAQCFDTTPCYRYKVQSTHCPKSYDVDAQVAQQASALGVLTSKVFGTLTCVGADRNADVLWCAENYGFVPFTEGKPDTAYRGYLFGRAAQFRFVGNGSCATRAAHAALKIREMLKDAPVKVVLQSTPWCDHYTVFLGSKKTWMVYDPLINGRLLFPFSYYQDNVIQSFPKVQVPARQFKLTITSDIVSQFDKRWPTIQKAMVQLVKERQENPHKLVKNPDFRDAMKAQDLQAAYWIKYSKAAIKALNLLAEKNGG